MFRSADRCLALASPTCPAHARDHACIKPHVSATICQYPSSYFSRRTPIDFGSPTPRQISPVRPISSLRTPVDDILQRSTGPCMIEAMSRYELPRRVTANQTKSPCEPAIYYCPSAGPYDSISLDDFSEDLPRCRSASLCCPKPILQMSSAQSKPETRSILTQITSMTGSTSTQTHSVRFDTREPMVRTISPVSISSQSVPDSMPVMTQIGVIHHQKTTQINVKSQENCTQLEVEIANKATQSFSRIQDQVTQTISAPPVYMQDMQGSPVCTENAENATQVAVLAAERNTQTLLKRRLAMTQIGVRQIDNQAQHHVQSCDETTQTEITRIRDFEQIVKFRALMVEAGSHFSTFSRHLVVQADTRIPVYQQSVGANTQVITEDAPVQAAQPQSGVITQVGVIQNDIDAQTSLHTGPVTTQTELPQLTAVVQTDKGPGHRTVMTQIGFLQRGATTQTPTTPKTDNVTQHEIFSRERYIQHAPRIEDQAESPIPKKQRSAITQVGVWERNIVTQTDVDRVDHGEQKDLPRRRIADMGVQTHPPMSTSFTQVLDPKQNITSQTDRERHITFREPVTYSVERRPAESDTFYEPEFVVVEPTETRLHRITRTGPATLREDDGFYLNAPARRPTRRRSQSYRRRGGLLEEVFSA